MAALDDSWNGWRHATVFARILGLLGFLLPAHPLSGRAQLPLPKLVTVFPAGAAVGSTNLVTVSGSDLDGPGDLLFSDPRIHASPSDGRVDAFEVVVPAEIRAGPFEVRYIGRFGASNPRRFFVSRRPEFVVAGTNVSAATAMALPLDAIAHGRVRTNQESWFRLDAAQGQRVLAYVEAREIDSRLEPELAVLDASGRELGIARHGAWVDFTAPAGGVFHLRLNDQMYRGGEDYVYRLTLTTGPYVEFVVPLAMAAGKTGPVTVFGRHLGPGAATNSNVLGRDGLPLEQLEVSVDAPAAADSASLLSDVFEKPAATALAGEAFEWRPRQVHAGEQPVLLAVTPLPVRSSLSNGLAAITLPCDFTGLFPRRGASSGVTFSAKKDQVFWVEVFADRYGFPCDPHVVIQRAKDGTDVTNAKAEFQDVLELGDADANAGGREFETGTRDAASRFQVPEDGAYRVLVRDLFRGGRLAGEFPYRLQIRPETPDFQLAAYPQPPPRKDDNDRQIHLWTPVLRRGETIPIRVVAFRRDGFDRAIELTATGLPSGVTAVPARIAEKGSATTLLLTAQSDAPRTQVAIQIVGRASSGNQELTRRALAAINRWQVPNWDQERSLPRFTDAFEIAVIDAEQAPVTLAPATSAELEVPVGGKLSLPLTITRRGEFNGAFKLKASGHAALEKAKELDVAEKATNAVLELNLADCPLPVGTHTIHFEGSVNGRYRNNPEAAGAAEEELKAAIRASDEAATAAKGATDQCAAARSAADEAAAALRESQATGQDSTPGIAEAHARKVEQANEARAEAERLLAAAETASSQATQRKTESEAKAKAANEKAQPRDVTVRVYSQPIVVRVIAPATS